MKTDSRVMCPSHPEYGFGTVRMVEENALGEFRCQVSFDHVDQYQALLPEDLVPVKGPAEAFASGELGPFESLARKLAAGCVLGENNVSGAFMRVAVQPLPHQAFLLDKLLSYGRFGHLLADDVGLGKTIEAGLIISALLQQGPDYKVLIVCPAGLALQWQEEMDEHFSLFFSVLGKNRDFNGKTSGGWQGRRLVIAPIDQIKRAEYAEVLRRVGPFNLVICDEAHRLGARREFLSGDLRTTANYRLFRELVDSRIIEFVAAGDGAPRSPRLLLLTATPHQGDDLRFGLLLRLIRPDLFTRDDETIVLELTAENLKEAVTRTPKAQAVDWDGKSLFKGHVSHTIDVNWTEAEKKAADLLTLYIHLSLEAAHTGSPGLALVVELVMHTFHKIAASSWRALLAALKNRKDAIEKNRLPDGSQEDSESDEEEDEGEGEIRRVLRKPAFFATEVKILEGVIGYLEDLRLDTKWDLCAKLLSKLDEQQPGVKVLFFTQYRTTQEFLSDRLRALFQGCEVEVIHGDVGLEQRRDARSRFEKATRFLVSTEAGGEGVNLQRACHVMINYDLPWNPMRLQQRIGRLDRYLQREVVQVFNLRVMNSWDNRISLRIIERLDAVQRTMGLVTTGAEDYREMILGAVADQIDETKLFTASLTSTTSEPTDPEIDAWITKAFASMGKWQKLLNRGLGMPEQNTVNRPQLSSDDFRRAFALALQNHGLKLMETRTEQSKFVDGVFHFTLPSAFKDPIFRGSPELYLTFDRDRFAEVRGQVLGKARGQEIKPILAGFGEPFTDWLFETAFAAAERDSAFVVRVNNEWAQGEGWLLVASLKWMGQGRRMKSPDSLVTCFQAANGQVQLLSGREVMHLLACAVDPGTPSEPIRSDEPNLENAKALVRSELRTRLENRDSACRASAAWSWLAVAQVQQDT